VLITKLSHILVEYKNAEKWEFSWLKRHNFVTVGTADNVRILLFNSYVKFHAKICTNC